LKYKKTIIVIFVLLAVISTLVQFFVSVNYDMKDYLPENAPSSEALEVMEDEFDDPLENTRVMVKGVSIQEAIAYKNDIADIDGVHDISWLDDAMDIRKPLEFADQDTVETYYKDNNALFTLSIDEGKEVKATDAIYDIIGEDGAMMGDALNTAISQEMTGKESFNAAAKLIPIVILILVLSTRSWFEPVLFLTAIGISVIINLGTNIFLGEISFISQAVAPILQLAVSLDYAIFLLHSFDDYRRVDTPENAMRKAIKRSFPAVAASASTTFFGFLALTFMDFEIGADLGLNLVKGILLSFLSVMVFLPPLTLVSYKLIDKTHHRQLIPNRYPIGNFVMKLRTPVMILIIIVIVPAFLAQKETNFIYGMGENPDNTRAGQDAKEIENLFDKFTPMVLLVPKEDIARQEALVDELSDLKHVKSTVDYTRAVGTGIPPEFLEESEKEPFFSDNYSRIVLNTTTEDEGDKAFAMVEKVKKITSEYYGDDYYATGESFTLYDMRDIVRKDNQLVNLLTVATIALVLLVTFRSISIPVVLILTIQTSVWVNLSFPYFTDNPLVYIGYLIISIVQLAATVDYAILFTEDYTNNRREMSKWQAIKKTINEKIFSIGVSASILSSVGFILSLTSSDPIISSIGILLGRGTLLAFLMVVFFLPGLLILFDKLIEKTSWKLNFFKGE